VPGPQPVDDLPPIRQQHAALGECNYFSKAAPCDRRVLAGRLTNQVTESLLRFIIARRRRQNVAGQIGKDATGEVDAREDLVIRRL
jgi:hypothetical protein